MARTKALGADENATLQGLARSVIDAHFGTQTAMAKATGLSQGHISTVKNGGGAGIAVLRALENGGGAGIAVLRALAKYRPVEIVRLLEIPREALSGLWSESEAHGVNVEGLPEPARRAARAAIELWGCTPEEAVAAARRALEGGAEDELDVYKLVGVIEHFLPKKRRSGVRRRSEPAK
jgi:hypothetical protein